MARRTRSYRKGNYIIPPTGLELIVADHCNISCRQCNHGSPAMPKWNANPSDLAVDLEILAGVLRPAYIKLIGGEPLLHPDLPGLIRSARNSGISDYFILVTNGMLFERVSGEIMELIDEIEISRYQASNLNNNLLQRASILAEEHAVKFTLNDFPDFRRTFTRRRIDNEELVTKIFRACKIANVWGCCAVYKGRIYRCPQSIYIPSLVGAGISEGLQITDAPSFRDELLDFLNSETPLASCRYCVGTAGRKQPHKLLARREWLQDLDEKAEDMIDWNLLERSLGEINAIDDCKIPVPSEHRPGLIAEV